MGRQNRHAHQTARPKRNQPHHRRGGKVPTRTRTKRRERSQGRGEGREINKSSPQFNNYFLYSNVPSASASAFSYLQTSPAVAASNLACSSVILFFVIRLGFACATRMFGNKFVTRSFAFFQSIFGFTLIVNTTPIVA